MPDIETDDTKLIHPVNSIVERHIIQRDLETLYKWSVDWQIEFNVNKCSVIHFGNNNKEFEYNMNDDAIESSKEERYLGVLIDKSLKHDKHISACVKKANRMLGTMRRKLVYREQHSMTSFYKSLVRPYLEYCVQSWNPYQWGHVRLIEGVQRKLIAGLRELPYEKKTKGDESYYT